jgi:hypothetical protein
MPTAAVALNRLHAQLRPHSSSSKAAMREYHLAGGSRKPPSPDGGSGPLLRRSSHAEDARRANEEIQSSFRMQWRF